MSLIASEAIKIYAMILYVTDFDTKGGLLYREQSLLQTICNSTLDNSLSQWYHVAHWGKVKLKVITLYSSNVVLSTMRELLTSGVISLWTGKNASCYKIRTN